jgi:hypothetical protein
VCGGENAVAFSISSAGIAPPAPGRGPGQDKQPFGVPAHPGSEVIKAEQVFQRGGIAGGALHAVKQAELLVQQRLIPQRQADEHLVDALAEAGLANGCLDRGALHGRERPGDVRDLGDPAGWQRRGFRRLDIDVFAAAQLLDEARQLLFSHPPGALVQAGEFCSQPAAEEDRDEHGDHDRQQAESACQVELGEQAVAQPG